MNFRQNCPKPHPLSPLNSKILRMAENQPNRLKDLAGNEPGGEGARATGMTLSGNQKIGRQHSPAPSTGCDHSTSHYGK
jgi:hypothetical protein